MKRILHIVLALVVLVLLNAIPADADRGGRIVRHGGGHGSFGLYVGPGWWWPYPYYYPYYPYYQQPPVVVEQPPEIDVQPAPRADENQYWYYCPDPQGYYPGVKKCPKGWLKVIPPANPPEGEE